VRKWEDNGKGGGRGGKCPYVKDTTYLKAGTIVCGFASPSKNSCGCPWPWSYDL